MLDLRIPPGDRFEALKGCRARLEGKDHVMQDSDIVECRFKI